MKKLTVAFLSMILALTLVSCGGTDPEPTEVPADDEAVEEEYESSEEELQKEAEAEEVYPEEETRGEYCIMGYDGGVVYSYEKEKYGALDSEGGFAVPCEYDYVNEYTLEVDGSKYNRYFVKKDGTYGMLDETGKEIIPIEYAFIDQGLDNESGDYPGRVISARKDKDGSNVYISALDGKETDENEFNAAVKEEAALVAKKDDEINAAWEKVPEDDDVETFDGNAMYARKKDGKLAVFKYSGEQLTDYKYTDVRESGDDSYTYHFLYSHLMVKDAESEVMCGVLDDSGREIAPCGSYTNIEEIKDGLIAVQKEKGGLFALATEKDGKLEVVTDFIYNTEHQTC